MCCGGTPQKVVFVDIDFVFNALSEIIPPEFRRDRLSVFDRRNQSERTTSDRLAVHNKLGGWRFKVEDRGNPKHYDKKGTG